MGCGGHCGDDTGLREARGKFRGFVECSTNGVLATDPFFAPRARLVRRTPINGWPDNEHAIFELLRIDERPVGIKDVGKGLMWR
jgi:hypothetical protein